MARIQIAFAKFSFDFLFKYFPNVRINTITKEVIIKFLTPSVD